MTPWWKADSCTLKALLLSWGCGVTGLASWVEESSSDLGEKASGQAAFLDLEAAFRAEGGTRPQEQAVLKWPEFQVQDRPGSHQLSA